MSESLLLRGGRVIDPESRIDALLDVRIADGLIDAVSPALEPRDDERMFDVTGCIVTPGWIDAHVHLRDPGPTYKEDLSTGAAAALAGGFTRMCCMPNTSPPLDSAALILDIITRSRSLGVAIHPIGTISIGRRGYELAPLEAMAAAGAIGFSDDGDSTASPDVMRSALAKSHALNLPIMVHSEDPELARGGSLHRGAVSAELGDPGIPAEAEESYIERDISLAEETGGWLHVLHVSTRRGADLIAAARARGVRVTAEVMPHHLALTDEWVAGRRRFAGESDMVDMIGLDTNAKVNPPLRPESDALGLIRAVRDDMFEFMATDHAPHALRDKPATLAEAAFGMTALELAIPTMTRIIERGALDWPLVVALFTSRPARTLNLPGGRIAPGDRADVMVVDPTRSWEISSNTLRSKSHNTPMLGMTLRGRAVLTISGGEVRHHELS